MENVCQSTIDRNRHTILDRWMKAGLDLFTGTMAVSSPAGESLASAMGMVLDNFEGGNGRCGEGVALITRFLAVQPVSPSVSLSLFTALGDILESTAPKGVVREACRIRVGQLLFDAFDRYMESRETLYRMKVEESQRKMHMMLRRASA